MNSNKFLIGILAGVAAGALVGILFAPEKGKKTRRKILRQGEDYAEELKEKFNEFLNDVTEKYERARMEADRVISKGKNRFDDSKKEAKYEHERV